METFIEMRNGTEMSMRVWATELQSAMELYKALLMKYGALAAFGAPDTAEVESGMRSLLQTALSFLEEQRARRNSHLEFWQTWMSNLDKDRMIDEWEKCLNCKKGVEIDGFEQRKMQLTRENSELNQSYDQVLIDEKQFFMARMTDIERAILERDDLLEYQEAIKLRDQVKEQAAKVDTKEELEKLWPKSVGTYTDYWRLINEVFDEARKRIH